jgi:hypothetical protein
VIKHAVILPPIPPRPAEARWPRNLALRFRASTSKWGSPAQAARLPMT